MLPYVEYIKLKYNNCVALGQFEINMISILVVFIRIIDSIFTVYNY